MMKQLFYLFLLLMITSCITQRAALPYSESNNVYKSQYLTFLDQDEKVLRTWYHYMVSAQTDSKFIFRQFYPEKKRMTHRAEYQDADLLILDGLYQEWWDDGSKRFECTYVNGQKHGTYTAFKGESAISVQGEYVDGQKNGLWLSYNSVRNGRTETTYKDGEQIGEPISYDSLNQVIVQELDNGENELGLKDQYKLVEEKPFMSACKGITGIEEREKCSIKILLTSLYENIRYPAKARELDVEGTAMVEFVVEKDGSIADVNVKRGICADMEKECLSAIKHIPLWEPGVQRGKKVRVQYTLPIKFKLE